MTAALISLLTEREEIHAEGAYRLVEYGEEAYLYRDGLCCGWLEQNSRGIWTAIVVDEDGIGRQVRRGRDRAMVVDALWTARE